MNDTTPTELEQLQAAHQRLLQQHLSLLDRIQADLDRTRGTLHHDIPLEVLADALPYSGAGPDEATALIQHLDDAGWRITPKAR